MIVNVRKGHGQQQQQQQQSVVCVIFKYLVPNKIKQNLTLKKKKNLYFSSFTALHDMKAIKKEKTRRKYILLWKLRS